MEETSCPICNQMNTELFFDKERDNNPVTYVICKTCGLVYQSPRKTQKEFEEYYQVSFREARVGDELEEYIQSRITVGTAIFEIINKILFQKKKNRFKRFLFGNRAFSVLDVGCGVGGVLVPFIKAGFQCKGIDTPSYYTNIGKNKLGIDIDEIFISEYKTDKKYDIIILNHVLEHFLNPLEELERIKSLLKDDGLLYIEVPDVERPYNWTSLQFFFMLGHVFYYSPKTLEVLANKAGFQRIFLESRDTPFMRNVFIKKKDSLYNADLNYYSELYARFNEIKKEKTS